MIFWRVICIIWIILLSSDAHAKHKKHTVHKTKTHAAKTVVRAHVIYGKQSLVAEISSILQAIDGNASVGVNVRSMKYGDTLYTKNDHRLFTPASIIKILTAEAALLYLGSEYKFPTTLLTDAQNMQNGIINGNVYLVQSGDPSLTYYDLTDLMVTLKSQQIRGINGSVFIDNTAYDENIFGPGWVSSDKQSCYGAPISASIVNRNCLSFKVAPAKNSGQLANIIQSPRYYYGDIQNAIVTKKPGTKSCYIQMNNAPGEAISVGGCMPKGREPWGVSTVVSDIMQYNKSMVHNLFSRYGIHVQGSIDAGEANRNLSTIAVHHSKPLHTLVNEMLKKSDNIIAGSLLKKMGEFYSKTPGSWENGGEAVKHILAKKAAVDASDLTIIDGSGLSRDNKVKPSQMMQVLDFAYHNYGTNYEFISALPIAGRDGTLKNRLHNVATKVRAKTGTMSGVVALAGYAISKDKEALAFVIIINGQNGMGWKYKEIEDRIVTALTNYSRSS